ncbi:MAG: hypothetical protein NW205_10400 [Hyphomicrobiaceae bacterium]|nr:hypothetical protein [Hyphomicrobiaceae bacterium]
MLFLGAASHELLNRCGLPSNVQDRLLMVTFIKAATDRAALGGNHSDPNLGGALGDLAAGMSVFGIGAQFGKAFDCASPSASAFADAVVRAVRANEKGRDGQEPVFVKTCAPTHGEVRCECLAKIGRAVIPNIYQATYSRDVIARIIQGTCLSA